jgi:hypothetical protein
MARTVEFEFKPFEELGIEAPKGINKDRALEQVGDYILESVLSYVADQNSPVAGYGSFPKLNKEYKKRKAEEGGSPIPNLELSGDMLSAMRIIVKDDSVVLRISGKEGDKADGHNNHSGDSELPLRRFIPDEGETFKKSILGGVKRIIDSFED